jgi:trans-aconitate methyltransferase
MTSITDTLLPRRLYWRALRALGGGRSSWNQQYEAGFWGSRERRPHTVDLVARLCAGGRLVEFGCGEGELPHLLAQGSFSSYHGLDISDIAVERAGAWAAEAGLEGCRFDQGDMAQWPGDEAVALILAEECLYYLKPEQIAVLLRRCAASLAPGGHVLAVVHSAEKHAETVAACRANATVVAEHAEHGGVYLTLAF